MNFIYGSPPDVALTVANPQPLSKAVGNQLGYYGLAAGLLFAVLLVLATGINSELKAMFKNHYNLFFVISGFIGITVAHEIVHFIAYGGLSPGAKVAFGFHPKAMMAFTFNPAHVSRNRFLFAVAMPLVVLTFVPFVLYWAGVPHANLALPLAMFNAVGAGGDMVLFFCAIKNVPQACAIQSSGMGEFWGKPL